MNMFMTIAPSRPVKMAVTPVAVIRQLAARVSVLLCVSVIVFLVKCGLKPKPLYLPNTMKNQLLRTRATDVITAAMRPMSRSCSTV